MCFRRAGYLCPSSASRDKEIYQKKWMMLLDMKEMNVVKYGEIIDQRLVESGSFCCKIPKEFLFIPYTLTRFG